MKFTVGGEAIDLTREQVIAAMADAPVEPIRKHTVEIADQLYPPKQVFATVTGRPRQSFTTMEAQRVLTRLGFQGRRVGQNQHGQPAWVSAVERPQQPTVDERLAQIEASVGTLQAAVGGLQARVNELETAALAELQSN